ncbi:hypothetical protein E4U39_005131 [Claviceps sp. Clav50 group G5]|nr:hypothetical protein E4U39_005131 [Claviceps sp. Clav50 group G5]
MPLTDTLMALLALGLGAHSAAAALTIITVTTTTTTTVSACAASCYPAPSIPGQDQIQSPLTFGDQPPTPLSASARPVGNFLPTVVLPAPAIGIPSSAPVEESDGSTPSTSSASVTILFDASTVGTVATSREDDTQTVSTPTTFVTGTRVFTSSGRMTSSEEGLPQYADPTSEVPSYEVDPPSYSETEVPSYGEEPSSDSGPPGYEEPPKYEEPPEYAEPPEYTEPPLYSAPSSQAAFPSDAGSYHVKSA